MDLTALYLNGKQMVNYIKLQSNTRRSHSLQKTGVEVPDPAEIYNDFTHKYATIDQNQL